MQLLIGNNIKQLRQRKNMTQEQLAEAMQVTCASVSKWERGESYPDITLLPSLAYYFGVSLDELMGYDITKIEQTIETILSEYTTLYHTDYTAARELILQAHKEYPNDYRILNCYMWNLAGSYADNDSQILLKYKDEILEICEKILLNCQDHHICFDALNMKAKIAQAEGKTEDALTIYKKHFVNWYETIGQKSEQLFSKNTPEFLYWVKKNMYELVKFSTDKLVKAHLFDNTHPIKEKLQKLEQYGEWIFQFALETNEPFFAIMAESLFGRLCNDLKYRNLGNTDADIIHIMEKYLNAVKKLSELSETDSILYEVTTSVHNTEQLLPFVVDYYLSAKQGKNAELLSNPEYLHLLKQYK